MLPYGVPPKPPRVPPPPVLRRPLPAPSRGPVIEVTAWREEESDTGQTNQSLAVYSSLLGVFDGLTPDERLEFVELAAIWAGMNRAERRVLMGLLARR